MRYVEFFDAIHLYSICAWQHRMTCWRQEHVRSAKRTACYCLWHVFPCLWCELLCTPPRLTSSVLNFSRTDCSLIKFIYGILVETDFIFLKFQSYRLFSNQVYIWSSCDHWLQWSEVRRLLRCGLAGGASHTQWKIYNIYMQIIELTVCTYQILW